MFKRKLLALDSQNAEKFNISDENEFRNMILWLEDQKIRHFKIEDRAVLRNIHSPDWEKIFDGVLENVVKPIPGNNYSMKGIKSNDDQEGICFAICPGVQMPEKTLSGAGGILLLFKKTGSVTVKFYDHCISFANKNAVPKEMFFLNFEHVSYLMELNCPYKGRDRCMILDWLLGYAVRLEYGDNVEKYKSVTPESVQMSRTGAAGASSNPLDCLNFDDPDFKAGVASLALLLQVPPYNDHLEQLKAICLIVKERLSKSSLEAAAKSSGKEEVIPLDKTELGFETGDYIMTEAAKILRLIHIHDLRELQTQINAAIVAVQAITANPKTDSRLGKVGR